METDRKKGHFTFRTTAVLIMLSGVFELFSITEEVLLFGEIRFGVTAGIYHIVYAVFFMALSIGLWGAKKWGYALVFAAAVLYSVDVLQFLFGQQAVEVYITKQIGGHESLLQSFGLSTIMLIDLFVLTRILVALCWWGFALYTWWRRDYFREKA